MDNNPIREMLPSLCALLAGSVVDRDIDEAAALAHKSEEDLWFFLKEGYFQKGELLWIIASPLLAELPQKDATEFEANLALVVKTVGLAAAKRAYRTKLLTDQRDTIEDTRYEIAATAEACRILDEGSIELEKLIVSSDRPMKDWKNSDICGTFRGQPVRIEVTVLHEALPSLINVEYDEYARQAKIASAFKLQLRHVLSNQCEAERLRALLELLHERHVIHGGADEEIDGVRFVWQSGSYHCSHDTSPIEWIEFFASTDFGQTEEFPGELRYELNEIIHPCSVRNMTPKYILEDYPNPSGVVTLADLPSSPKETPVSTKIHQMLCKKLDQCEAGIINIVAFGTPSPMNDHDVVDAVCGVNMVMIPINVDAGGVRQAGAAESYREGRAPFVPSKYLAKDHQEAFVDAFRKLSGVWNIRLGMYPMSRFLANPNAAAPAPRELISSLAPASVRGPEADGQRRTPAEGGLPESATTHNVEANDEEILWVEMAQDLVNACGSAEAAKGELEALKRSGLSVDELRSQSDRVQSDETRKRGNLRIESPTNQEIAVRFVLDCGAFELAFATLELCQRN